MVMRCACLCFERDTATVRTILNVFTYDTVSGLEPIISPTTSGSATCWATVAGYIFMIRLKSHIEPTSQCEEWPLTYVPVLEHVSKILKCTFSGRHRTIADKSPYNLHHKNQELHAEYCKGGGGDTLYFYVIILDPWNFSSSTKYDRARSLAQLLILYRTVFLFF